MAGQQPQRQRTLMFNFRVDADLFDLIDDAAQAQGLTRSMWTREVLASVASGGVTLEQLRDMVAASGVEQVSPHPARYLPLQGQTGRSTKAQATCLHPKSAIRQLPFTDVCGVCGATVKDRRR